MTVTTPAVCSREDVQMSLDIKDGTIAFTRLDRAVQSVSRDIEGRLHRTFYPFDYTDYWDWPNYQRAEPWRVWFDRHDCLCINSFYSGGVEIYLNQCFLRPQVPKPGFPFTSVELDRSTTATFGGNAATPQNAIQIGATWGFTGDADDVCELVNSESSSATPVLVTDGSQTGVGDLLILGYSRGTAPYPSDTLGHAGLIQPYAGERVLVTDRAASDTSLAQSGSGCSTASSADNALQWTGAGEWPPVAGEAILLDQEQMFVEQVNNSVATVVRAWNGTQLQTHSSAEIYAYRSLSVTRGYAGTTAASWTSGTAVYKHRYPSLIKALGVAEGANRVLQEVSGYSRTVGTGDAAMPASGAALAALWDKAQTEYGRAKARVRGI